MRNRTQIKKYILGAVRELVSYDGKVYFLSDNIDRKRTGIYTAQTLEEWEDEDMLVRISAKGYNFKKCSICGKRIDITSQDGGVINDMVYCIICLDELDSRSQQQTTSGEY